MNWPEDLVLDLAKRRCVLFLGSGISMNSIDDHGNRPPSWTGFLEEGIKAIPADKTDYIDIANKYLKSKDLLMACEVIKKGLGRDRFVSLLKAKFQTPGYKKDEIHETIFDLDSRIVITPNFDKIYDSYATGASSGTTVVKSYYDSDIVDCIRRDEPIIIKMHGSIDTPDNLIFSRVDYSKAWIKHVQFYRIIESLLLSHTFLFLGAGINDPDIKLLLETIAFSYCPSRKHYFVIPANEVDAISKEIYSSLLHLEFIEYDSKDNHKELKESLESLRADVDNKRSTPFL